MWSQKLKSGNVCYRERYTDPLTGKTKTATVTLKPSGRKSDSRLAEDALKEKIARLTESTANDNITFGKLCDEYFEYQKRVNKRQTAINTQCHMNTIRRLIGDDVLVNKLTAPFVIDKMWSDNPITYNERVTRFKAMIRWAYRFDYVKSADFLDKIMKAKAPTAREKDALKYLEHDEIEKLLSGMTVWKWRDLTEFLMLSGLRLGEALALNDEDVDTDKREITVNKTLAPSTGEITTTKTITSNRKVFMQDELLECCIRIKKEMREEQVRFVYRTKIFLSTDTGEHVNHSTYEKYFRENTERILGRRLTPHCLRHTHTALLAEAGVPIETISRRLGHANSKITREVYMHVTNNMRDRDRKLVENVKMLHVCYT